MREFKFYFKIFRLIFRLHNVILSSATSFTGVMFRVFVLSSELAILGIFFSCRCGAESKVLSDVVCVCLSEVESSTEKFVV